MTTSHLKFFKKGTMIGTEFYFNEHRVGVYDHETKQGSIIIESEDNCT